MRVLTIFPKSEFYSLKDINTKRIIREAFQNWLLPLQEAGAKFECLIEDSLAIEIMSEMLNESPRAYTVLDEVDYNLITKYGNKIPEEYYRLSSLWKEATKLDLGASEKIPAPIIVKYKDKSKWLPDRLECIDKRIKYSVSKLLRQSDAVLMFRGGGSNDAYSSLAESLSEGDGKLYIEVNASTGIGSCYYGGVFIDRDAVKMIVGL